MSGHPLEEKQWKQIGTSRYSVSDHGDIRNDRFGRILKPSVWDGRAHVKLMMTNNPRDKPINYSVHRLVAQAFIPNPENKPQVDHVDNDPLNNHISNLRWATNSENMANIRRPKSNSTGEKGVYVHTTSGKYMAYVGCEGKLNYLGLFDTLEQAKAYRDEIAGYIQGEFFKSN